MAHKIIFRFCWTLHAAPFVAFCPIQSPNLNLTITPALLLLPHSASYCRLGSLLPSSLRPLHLRFPTSRILLPLRTLTMFLRLSRQLYFRFVFDRWIFTSSLFALSFPLRTDFLLLHCHSQPSSAACWYFLNFSCVFIIILLYIIF